jgi:2-keto-3-deoxy-L-rhamnonate aldolase RhmA
VELRKNRVKRKLANDQVAVVAAGFTHPDDIDAFGPVGFDGVWLEGEHGGVDAAELGNLTRACDIWGMTSVVRINANDQGLIYRTLDRGAQAIVVPHVNTAAEAGNVVAGGKFAPLGKRGLFTSRQGYGVPDYLKKANDETVLIILIEDIVAWENLDEILTVPGIDVFFVAPGDFAASMGHIGASGHPDVQAKITDALERIVAAGHTAGTLANNEDVERFVQMGVRFFLVSAHAWIAKGAKDFMEKANPGSRKA